MAVFEQLTRCALFLHIRFSANLIYYACGLTYTQHCVTQPSLSLVIDFSLKAHQRHMSNLLAIRYRYKLAPLRLSLTLDLASAATILSKMLQIFSQHRLNETRQVKTGKRPVDFF